MENKDVKKKISFSSVIHWVTFLVLFAVSIVLSVILYIGLSHDKLSFWTFLGLAVAIEGTKIVTLTRSNTERWSALRIKKIFINEYISGWFKLSKRRSITDGNLLNAVLSYSKHRQTATGLLCVYILTAMVSLTASFGYTLQTTYLSTRGKQVVSTQSTQDIYKEQLQAIDDIIAQNKKVIKGYESDITLITIQMAAEGLDTKTINSLQAKKDSLQKKIDTANIDISKKLQNKEEINNKLLELNKQEIDVSKTLGKTQYQLMGETFGISDSSVMFIILFAVSIVIEVALFVMSPHSNEVSEEDERIFNEHLAKENILHPKTTDITTIAGTSIANSYSDVSSDFDKSNDIRVEKKKRTYKRRAKKEEPGIQDSREPDKILEDISPTMDAVDTIFDSSHVNTTLTPKELQDIVDIAVDENEDVIFEDSKPLIIINPETELENIVKEAETKESLVLDDAFVVPNGHSLTKEEILEMAQNKDNIPEPLVSTMSEVLDNLGVKNTIETSVSTNSEIKEKEELVDSPQVVIEKKEEPEVKVEPKVEVVKKVIDKFKLIDSFIDALFDEKGKMLNKEDVAKSVGLPMVHVIKIVDALTNKKMITFRPSMGWYRNVSIEDMKKSVASLYGS